MDAVMIVSEPFSDLLDDHGQVLQCLSQSRLQALGVASIGWLAVVERGRPLGSEKASSATGRGPSAKRSAMPSLAAISP